MGFTSPVRPEDPPSAGGGGGQELQAGHAWKPSLRIAIAYALIAGTWIPLSDATLAALVSDESTITRLQTLKGWTFIAFTSLLLFMLIKRSHSVIEQAARRQARSDEFLQQIFESSPLGIVVVDREGHYIQVNQPFADLLGYSKAELVGMHHSELTLADDVALTAGLYEQLDRDRASRVAVEKRYVRRDGSVCWSHLTAGLLHTDGSMYAIAIIKDITERKQREMQLQATVEALRSSDEERRSLLDALLRAEESERQRIAADIHDDTLQVMTSVLLGLEIAAESERPERLRDVSEDAARRIRMAMKGLRDLVFELRPVLVEREGLAAALKLYLQEAADAGGGFRWSVDDRLEVELPSQARLLAYRVGREALVNAVKHSGAADISVELTTSDGGAHVCIHDNGRGFDTEAVPPPTQKSFGLELMRERVEMFGGWFKVSSQPGMGATVDFWIPRDPASDAAVAQLSLDDVVGGGT